MFQINIYNNYIQEFEEKKINKMQCFHHQLTEVNCIKSNIKKNK